MLTTRRRFTAGLITAPALLRAGSAGAAGRPVTVASLLGEDKPETKIWRRIAEILARTAPGVKLMLTTYYGGLNDNLETALALPVAGLHLDLVRGADQLDRVLAAAPHTPRSRAMRTQALPIGRSACWQWKASKK